MEAKKLYEQLDKDFIKKGITEINWLEKMPKLDKYLCENFKQCEMGLMCDFADEIDKVYTTVFLSDIVLEKVLSENITNAMIFSHHPTNWDIECHGGNYAASEMYIKKLQERKISIYFLHHPLDNFGEYSTCKTFADRIGIKTEQPAFLYYGAFCGLFGTIDCNTTSELSEKFSLVMGHKTSLYQYGSENIANEKIALCPGGGNAMFVLDEMLKNGVKTLVTGVTVKNNYSKNVHDFENINGINVLGGTHYSTEKFATMKMCEYFKKLGVLAKFVNDEPKFFDL